MTFYEIDLNLAKNRYGDGYLLPVAKDGSFEILRKFEFHHELTFSDVPADFTTATNGADFSLGTTNILFFDSEAEMDLVWDVMSNMTDNTTTIGMKLGDLYAVIQMFEAGDHDGDERVMAMDYRREHLGERLVFPEVPAFGRFGIRTAVSRFMQSRKV